MLKKNVIKFFLYFILVIITTLFQLSFIEALPVPWNHFNVVVPLLFFFTLMINYRLGLWSAMISAMVLEMYSPLVFGNILLPLIFSLILINFVFSLLFTNRSLFSLLILSSVGFVCFNFLNFIYVNIFYYFGISNLEISLTGGYLSGVFLQLFFSIIFLGVLFTLLRIFSKRFRSVFLVSGRR
ncbi:MAG: hypothetical protein WC310_04605 [Patescibacteria group bacterium]|jgi:hypothetical protein